MNIKQINEEFKKYHENSQRISYDKELDNYLKETSLLSFFNVNQLQLTAKNLLRFDFNVIDNNAVFSIDNALNLPKELQNNINVFNKFKLVINTFLQWIKGHFENSYIEKHYIGLGDLASNIEISEKGKQVLIDLILEKSNANSDIKDIISIVLPNQIGKLLDDYKNFQVNKSYLNQLQTLKQSFEQFCKKLQDEEFWNNLDI